MPNASRFKVNIPPTEMKKGVWSTTHQMKLLFYLHFWIESPRWWSLLVFYGSKGKRVELAHNTFMNYRYMHLYCLLFYTDKHLWSRTGITKWCTSYEEINDIQLDPFFILSANVAVKRVFPHRELLYLRWLGCYE